MGRNGQRWAGMGWARSDRTGQWRTRPDRDGHWAGHGWTISDRAGPGSVRQGRTGPSRAEQGQTGRARPERTGQGLTGPDRARNGQLVPARARQDRTFCIYVCQQHSCPEHCAVPASSLLVILANNCICGLSTDPTYQVIPSPSLPSLASTVLSGCVGSCLAFIGPARSCLALPYFTLPCAVLSDLSSPVWRCSARPCLTLPDPALFGHAQPCLALLCSILSGAALSGPTQPCLALPYSTLAGTAWPGPVRHCPAHPYPILPGPVRPVRTLLAMFGTVWSCPVLSDPVRSCLALLGGPVSPVPCPVARVVLDSWVVSQIWLDSDSNESSQSWVGQQNQGYESSQSRITLIVIWVRVE